MIKKKKADRCPDKKLFGTCFKDFVDVCIKKPFVFTVSFDNAVFQLSQTAKSCADPKASIGCLDKRGNYFITVCSSDVYIYLAKRYSIESKQPGRSSQPEITVMRLQDTIDGVCRQTVVSQPCVMPVLINGFRRIKSIKGKR